MNKIVAVTGGAGYIGAQTCKYLKQQGYTPVVFDNLETGLKENVKWGDFVLGDLRNYEDISQFIKHYQPIGIIHCAAYLNVFESVSHPGKYFHNNVLGTLNLLNAMVENSVKSIVFSSTCAIYGNATAEPLVETTAIGPLSPYGSSKLSAEYLIKSYDHAHGIKSVILRYFNVAGADKDLETGAKLDDASHLISVAVKCATGMINKMYIFGEDYPTRDGTCIRDYIHNEDLASAHFLSLMYLLNNAKSELFNLGTEQGYTVKEVLAAVEKVANCQLNAIVTSRREGDPAALSANASKIKNILKWSPKYSNLEDIVDTAYQWALAYKKINE